MEELGRENDKVRNIASYVCRQINTTNPVAVAESIKDMYEALKEARITLNVLQPEGSAVIREIDAALSKAEGK